MIVNCTHTSTHTLTDEKDEREYKYIKLVIQITFTERREDMKYKSVNFDIILIVMFICTQPYCV